MKIYLAGPDVFRPDVAAWAESVRELCRRYGFEPLLPVDHCETAPEKIFQANKTHPLYIDIHSIILKETGIDRVIEKVIHRLGNITSVYLTGDFAHGKDSPVIELILVGADIDREYLARKVTQAEDLVGRKVSYIVLEPEESEGHLLNLTATDLLPLWEVEATKGINK